MITKYLSNIPISIGAIILSLAAMGNLVSSILPFSREISLLIGLPLLLITISKLIVMPKTLKNDLNNPILASVIAAFSMSFMLWSMFLYTRKVILTFLVYKSQCAEIPCVNFALEQINGTL